MSDVKTLAENLQSIACYEGGQFHPWMGEVAGEAAKALQAAAGRVPDDVKSLVDEARRIGSQFEGLIGHYAEHRPLIRALAAALEAAYSQKGADRDPR